MFKGSYWASKFYYTRYRAASGGPRSPFRFEEAFKGEEAFKEGNFQFWQMMRSRGEIFGSDKWGILGGKFQFLTNDAF